VPNPASDVTTDGSLAKMAEDDTAESTDAAEPREDAAAPRDDDAMGPVFSGYGVASVVLGLVCVAAVALSLLIWSGHRARTDTLDYQVRVEQAAVDWTGVLINMNKDNIDSSLGKLHDGTVGQLNKDFEATMQPYRDVVLKLQSRSSGQIDSASIESLHHADVVPGERAPGTEASQPEFASRTDFVLVVATSVSQNAGDNAKPQVVQWNLRLGVSDVDGKLLISRLEWIR
jgi:hypothetical protein